jgi:hypothetical protein
MIKSRRTLARMAPVAYRSADVAVVADGIGADVG